MTTVESRIVLDPQALLAARVRPCTKKTTTSHHADSFDMYHAIDVSRIKAHDPQARAKSYVLNFKRIPYTVDHEYAHTITIILQNAYEH